uniref:Uncharacterized protein n=1 Tax=Trichuris muris TaxID=70415 RepID=A0A5S6QE23_TRIMR
MENNDILHVRFQWTYLAQGLDCCRSSDHGCPSSPANRSHASQYKPSYLVCEHMRQFASSCRSSTNKEEE